jgi:hemolysin activation/secretion protein
VDHGEAFLLKEHGESIDQNDYLNSAGFGLMINLSKYLMGRVSLGVPIANREKVKDSFRLHFYLQSNLL